jgi:hypothetical protein
MICRHRAILLAFISAAPVTSLEIGVSVTCLRTKDGAYGLED